MYSSTEDSDSDSGTNFKRGKRKPKEDSPLPASKVSRVDHDRRRDRRDDDRRRDETSRKQVSSNGDNRRRVSPERSRHKREASSSKDVRPKSSDKQDRREAKDDRHKREEVKKRRTRSRSRDRNQLPSSPKQRHTEDFKETSGVDKIRPSQSKQLKRSKSPSKHSRERSRHHSHSSSHKESKEKVSRERQHSTSRHAQEKTGSSSQEPKKPSSHETPHASYGPVLPPPSKAPTRSDDHMPAMPQKMKTKSQSPRRNIGPSLPKDFRELLEARAGNYDVISSEDEECTIGPMPTSTEMSERDLELEKRKIEIKLQQLDRQREAVTNKDVKFREEWMLELPEVRRVGDVGVTSRQFRKNDRPDFSDRTDWTKTPNDEHKKPRHDQKKLDEDKKRELEVKRRDDEQEKMAKEHKKSHKRDKSLLEIHEKKLKKEKVSLDGCGRKFS